MVLRTLGMGGNRSPDTAASRVDPGRPDNQEERRLDVVFRRIAGTLPRPVPRPFHGKHGIWRR
jgi:hypothetical protein